MPAPQGFGVSVPLGRKHCTGQSVPNRGCGTNANGSANGSINHFITSECELLIYTSAKKIMTPFELADVGFYDRGCTIDRQPKLFYTVLQILQVTTKCTQVDDSYKYRAARGPRPRYAIPSLSRGRLRHERPRLSLSCQASS